MTTKEIQALEATLTSYDEFVSKTHKEQLMAHSDDVLTYSAMATLYDNIEEYAKAQECRAEIVECAMAMVYLLKVGEYWT